MNRILLTLALATLGLAGVASQAHAWGGFHAGYTHFGPYGVEHYGYNSLRGPYGAYYGDRGIGYRGYDGGFTSGYGYSSRYGYLGKYGDYRYSPAYGGIYGVGGYPYGDLGYGYGGYGGGYYRAW